MLTKTLFTLLLAAVSIGSIGSIYAQSLQPSPIAAGGGGGGGGGSDATSINGVTLSGLATGLLKNTAGTGAPSIAVGSDVCGLLTLTGDVTTTAACATTISAAIARLASPTFTGTVTIPTPFTLGATSVTSTGTQLNYLNAATGTTGTTSTNLVFSGNPTIAGATFTGNLLFTDAIYDIGASGATRPRDGYFSRNLTVGSVASFATVTIQGGNSTGATLYVQSGNGVSSNLELKSTSGSSTADLFLSATSTHAYLGNVNAFPIDFYTTNAIRMTIQSGGEVDVGTTTARGGSQLFAVAGGTGTNGDIIAGTRFTCTTDGCSPVAGGATAGTFTVTTTGVSTPVVTMGGSGFTATAGFVCSAQNQTTANLMRQTASSTTTATFSGTTVSGDTISFVCHGY